MQTILTSKQALKRKGQRDFNKKDDLGLLHFPELSSFTGCTLQAVCWNEAPRTALLRQNEDFCGNIPPRKFTGELALVWESLNNGTYWDWRERNSRSNPLKHQGQNTWSRAWIVKKERVSADFPNNALAYWWKRSNFARARAQSA